MRTPGKRSADHDGGNDAKSDGTEQAPSQRRPLIRNPVDLMNGFGRFGIKSKVPLPWRQEVETSWSYLNAGGAFEKNQQVFVH